MDQATDKALDALRQLAGKLGQTVEYLWPEYLRFLVWDVRIPGTAWSIFTISLGDEPPRWMVC